ncbi:Zinc finger protein 28 [Araneus ventricosus]|uniref:Zinc finger protein 28 n=1 Tax=Araneus ventricosus TaxID=182803 RepID=A0A4Y2QBP8_ARAVE|nr:Zinc finger protein 28 [Araneus ventricosus]GBN60931.1 Zinc finger protein 28 [Araneus ventricosus]
MSGRKHLPSKEVQSFISYREKQDQRSNRNEDNSSGDSESRNQTHPIVISGQHCNNEISPEGLGQKSKQKTTVEYPTKKSRILLTWKQDQDQGTNIAETEVTKSSGIEFANSNLHPASIFGHCQNANGSFSVPPKVFPEIIDESKDSKKENNYSVMDDDLAVAGPSHFTSAACNKVFDHESVLEDNCNIHSVKKSVEICVPKLPNSEKCIYKCILCHETFVCKENLDIHYRIHNDEERYLFEKWEKYFSDPGNFSSHQKHCGSLSEDRKHECDLCHKKFKRKEHLMNHYRIHTGQKPFECERCKMRFSHTGNFSTHRKNCGFLGEDRQHECDLCHKKFKRKQHLIGHYRIHTGVKPYTCKKCGKIFSFSNSLSKHRKKCGSSSESQRNE